MEGSKINNISYCAVDTFGYMKEHMDYNNSVKKYNRYTQVKIFQRGKNRRAEFERDINEWLIENQPDIRTMQFEVENDTQYLFIIYDIKTEKVVDDVINDFFDEVTDDD